MKSNSNRAPERLKRRVLPINHATGIAIDEALDRLEAKSKGALCTTGRSRVRQLNLIIRKACEAVVNWELGGRGVPWPFEFDARPGTQDECLAELQLMGPDFVEEWNKVNRRRG